MKHNPRELNRRIVLQRPSTPVRDALGGIQTTTYTAELSLFAKVTTKNQSRQEIVGDFVTVDTRYFIVRDIRRICPDIDLSWRISYRDFTFLINDIQLLDEESPPYTQITATAVNGAGRIMGTDVQPQPEPTPEPEEEPAQTEQEEQGNGAG